MKLLFFIVLLLAVCVYVLAQEDTTRIIKPVQVPLLPPDSIHQQLPSPLPQKTTTPDYKQLDKALDIWEKEITFSFDTPKKPKNVFNSSYSKFIVPASLIGFGVATRNTKSPEEMDIQWDENGKYSGKKTPIDDYLRYTPYIGIYGLDLVGVKAKHNFRDRTFVTVTSFLIMDQAVNLMKDNIPTWRPDGSGQRSFPSSHTSTAFVGAHIMFKEYKDSSPWAASTGYALATTTGALRMVNKKHSLADVAAGAGIGILSVEASYLLLPVFHKIFGIKEKNKNLVIIPSIGTDNIGIGAAYTF